MEFFTKPYFDELADKLNADATFQDKAKSLSTTLIMSATDKERTFRLSIENGKASVEEATPETDAVFKFLGPYDAWVANHKGEAPLEKQIMTGKIKFKGSMAKILGVRAQLTQVDNVAQSIPVEY